jgi:hypothetical protein
VLDPRSGDEVGLRSKRQESHSNESAGAPNYGRNIGRRDGWAAPRLRQRQKSRCLVAAKRGGCDCRTSARERRESAREQWRKQEPARPALDDVFSTSSSAAVDVGTASSSSE